MNGNPFALHGSIPDLNQLQTYSVNRKGEYEGVRQTLYDFQTYAAAGQSQLQFFQVPLGQAGKTIEQTNMDQAGALPTPKYFLVESIEIYFYPAANISALQNDVLANLVDTDYSNDVQAVARAGALTYFIGSKNYLQEAPLNRFPPKTCLKTEGAYALQDASLGIYVGPESRIQQVQTPSGPQNEMGMYVSEGAGEAHWR